VLVGIALVCLLSTDRLLLLLFARIPLDDPEEEDLEPDEETVDNPLVRAFNWFFRPPVEKTRPMSTSSFRLPAAGKLRWSIVVAGVLLMLVQGIGLQPRLQAGPQSAGDLSVDGQTLAERYDGWNRGEYEAEQRSTESMWGERSSSWDFFRGPRSARVSLDYPFQGWHELVNCYRNTGWQIDRREVRREGAAAGDWPLVVVVMQDETGRHATLCYSVFDGDGNPVLPARDQLTAGVVDRWKRSTGRLGTYQVQTFSAGLTPPGEEDVEELVRLHCGARRDLVRAVVEVEE
jgi:hypothetical protein